MEEAMTRRGRGRPPVAEGERSRTVGCQLPESVIEAIDDLIGPYGNRSIFIRKAIMRYVKYQQQKKNSE